MEVTQTLPPDLSEQYTQDEFPECVSRLELDGTVSQETAPTQACQLEAVSPGVPAK